MEERTMLSATNMRNINMLSNINIIIRRGSGNI